MPALSLTKFLPTIAAFIASAIGWRRVQHFDKASKIFWWYTCAGFLVEATARYAAVVYGNNMPVYGIYSLFAFGLTAAYFNYSVDVLRVRNIGLYIGAFGVALGILNSIFIQPLNVLSSYFLYFEGIVILGLALFSFFRMMLISDGMQLYKLRHFWFPVILCFFWSITFFNWGLYGYFNANEKGWMWLINLSIIAVSSTTYLAIAVVFWNYPKLKAAGD